MEQFSPELKYKKMSGFATTKGQLYETKVSALLFLRGINSGLDFQLGSNVEGAGALDDIVFRVRGQTDSDKWTSYFVQLKHKERSWINQKMLIANQGPFSLLKYCESYENIKEAMTATERKVLFDGDIKDCFFVIFTNARLQEDLGNECRSAELIDEFLGSSSGKIFSFNSDHRSETDKAIFDSLQGCVNEGRDFLERLRIFAGQPREADLDILIKKEMDKTASNTKGIDMDRLYDCFVENIKTWCEDRRNVLHQRSDIFAKARDRALAETCSLLEVNANKLDLLFEETALSPLRELLDGDFPLLHITSSEELSLLTSTKLLQIFDDSSFLYLGSACFLLNQNAVISEWKTGRHNTLIVSISNEDSVTDASYFNQILELCKTAVNPKKRLIILTDKKIKAAIGFKHFIDTFQFSSLTPISHKQFLRKTFVFQGYPISFENYFECCDGATNNLSASMVVEIIKTGAKFSLASILPDPNKYYLPRSLQPAQPNVLKSLFQVTALSETILISNMTMPNIVEIFLQDDTSLSEETVQQNLFEFRDSLVPDERFKTVFTGNSFSLGRFICNYVGLSGDKISALRIHSIKDVTPFCFFLFMFQETSEEDVTKLAELHHSRHFLIMENGKLRLLKTFDDGFFLREHIDFLHPETFLDVSERVMIVCGEPGMGKSTLMTHLAKETKKDQPHLWVVVIALNHNTQLFVEGKHNDAIGFILAATKTVSPLQQSMFRLALEVTGNVVIALDGYDEIAPTYVDHCCTLLSNLLKTKTKKVWITTRISVKEKLENHLSISAARLFKLGEADQRCFLKRYWSDARASALESGKKVLSDKEVDEFIDRLLKTMFVSIKDFRSDFLGVPLQAQIMAEVFVEHVTDVTNSSHTSELPDKFDWLKLLDWFIEKKLAVYLQDKLKIKPSDTNYFMHLDNERLMYLTFHMEAALHLIFTEDYVKELQSKYFSEDFFDFLKKIETGVIKTGFIDSINNGKARFVHRVFAEYFVAKWFAANLSEYATFLKKETYHAYSGAYKVLRFLCDLILANGCELHTAVLNGDVDKVTTLLAEGSDVNATDKVGRTPLHLTAGFGRMEHTVARHVEVLDLLIHARGTNFNLKDELLHYTPLGYADMNEYFVMVNMLLAQKVDTKFITTIQLHFNTLNLIDCILSNDLEHLLEFCIDSDPDFKNSPFLTVTSELRFIGNGLLANACQFGNFRTAKLLIKRGYNLNGESQSLYACTYPPLHCASQSGHLEIVKLLLVTKGDLVDKKSPLSKVSEKSHPECFPYFETMLGLAFLENLYYVEPDFVNRKSKHGRTALHEASERGHAGVVSFLINHGADLESRDAVWNTCLHMAADKNQPNTVKAILDVVSEEKRLAFVNLSNVVKMTPLHFGAKAGSLEIVRMLVGAGGRMAVDRYRQTPLMLAARLGHLEVIKFLVWELNVDSNGDGICNTLSSIDWINVKDKDGWTALSLATMFGYENIVMFLTEQGADRSGRDGPLGPDSGMPKDHFDEDCYCHQWDLTYLYFIKNNNAPSTYRISFNAFDGRGNTTLHIAAWKGYLKAVDIFVKWGARIADRNDYGRTPLMLAAGRGYFYVVEYILNAFDTSLNVVKNADDINSKSISKVEFVNMKDRHGATAVYQAARYGHVCTVELLVKHGADIQIIPDVVGQPFGLQA